MSDYAIVVSGISKRFRLFKSPRDRLKEAFSLSKKSYHKDFWALRDVSFSVKKGETVGIIGVNGSGKSTILKIICGYLTLTSGSVRTQNRIASVLELGTGFDRNFTGRENVMLYGGLMGLSRKQTLEKMPLVEAFADIGDFFERPMRQYSNGMFMRVAFACTSHMDPDILIIDEALAVGDIAFQHKCINRIKNMQNQGTTILFVSHSISAVKSLCQRAIMLDKGQKIIEGKAEDVANYYHSLLAESEQQKASSKIAPERKNTTVPAKTTDNGTTPRNRVGTGELRVEEVFVKDKNGNVLKYVEFNQEVCISTKFTAIESCKPAVFGCSIRDRYGVDLLGTNTAVEGLDLPSMEKDESCRVDFVMCLPLLKGSYSITVALGHDPERPIFYDWWDNSYVFEILPPIERRLVNCKVHLPIQINIEKIGNSDSRDRKSVTH